MLLSRWWDFCCLQDTHLNLQRFNRISRCFILQPLFTCARNLLEKGLVGLYIICHQVIHWYCEACEYSSEPRYCVLILIFQTLTAASLQLRGAALRNGTLCGMRVHWRRCSQNVHMKMLLQRQVVENRRSSPDDYSSRMYNRSNRLAWGTLYQISFWVETLHSFLTFTVGSVHPSLRPLGSQSAVRPHQPLWKNPVHLTCIAWLHLCVLFGPCRWRRRVGRLPAAAPRPTWCHPPAPP